MTSRGQRAGLLPSSVRRSEEEVGEAEEEVKKKYGEREITS